MSAVESRGVPNCAGKGKMACPDIVVVGASAGGLEAVTALLRALPASFSAAVLVVIHRGSDGPTKLPSLLADESALPVRVVAESEAIRGGVVYLPPLDCHLLIDDSRVVASRGPRQHGFRPAVDPLFISAANARGKCVAGVILSGGLDDGSAGLLAIKRQGGVAIVQDPNEAIVSSMPLNALRNVEADAVLPAAAIGPRLVELTKDAVNSRRPDARTRPSEGRKTMTDPSTPELSGKRKLTPFTCPECGGALWEVEEAALDQYECHVGHRFGSEALQVLADDRTENLLWAAVRALQEDSMLRRRMAARAERRGAHALARRWLDDAETFAQRSREIRVLIEAMNDGPDETTGRRSVEHAPAARPKTARKPVKRARQTGGGKKRRQSDLA